MIIYHASCIDGFVSALQAWLVFPDAEFCPLQYGDAIPSEPIEYILDFSIFPIPYGAVMLDHHATTFEKLGLGLDNPVTTFNMVLDNSKSGCRLAQEYFKTPPSWLIDYAEDHDLWRKELLFTDEIHAGLGLMSLEPTAENFASWRDLKFDDVRNSGAVILKYVKKVVDGLVVKALPLELKGYNCRIVNTGFSVSEVGHEILKKFDCDVAICWFAVDHETCVYSCRSVLGQARKLAEIFGGGGHANAAGFKIANKSIFAFTL